MHKQTCVPLLAALLAVAGVCGGEERRGAGEGRYRAQLKAVVGDPQTVARTVVLNVTEISTARVREISFSNPTVKVVDMFPLPGERLVVHGELHSGGDIVTVVDLEHGKVLDTLWSWDWTFSPDRTLAVYTFRYPPASLPTYRTTVVLAYDFTKDPLANTVNDRVTRPGPTNRGFILYPEVNRLERRYFIPALTEADRRSIPSPFAWCGNNRKIAFFEHNLDLTYLVVIDIAQGLAAPVVHRSLLDAVALMKQSPGGAGTEAQNQGRILAKSLQFVDECTALDAQLYPRDGPDPVRVTLDLAGNLLRR